MQDQTLKNVFHIVVDDGSTDASFAVAQAAAAGAARVHVVSTPNGGVARARNAGYKALVETNPQAEYLLFLDADDCLESTALETMALHLRHNPSVSLVFCGLRVIDESGKIVSENLSSHDYQRFEHPEQLRHKPGNGLFGVVPIAPDDPDTPFATLYAGCVWGHYLPSAAMMRRSAFDATPGWDEDFGQPAEDTDLFLHLALRGEVHFLHEHKLMRYRRHNSQCTAEASEAKHAHSDRQLAKLYDKWEQGRFLTNRQKEIVAKATRFRKHQFDAHLFQQWAVNHLRRGEVAQGLASYSRSIKRYFWGSQNPGR